MKTEIIQLSKITRTAVIADSLLEALHLLNVVLAVFRVDATIPILGIAMVADSELGKLDEVPEKTVSPQQETYTVGPVSRRQP